MWPNPLETVDTYVLVLILLLEYTIPKIVHPPLGTELHRNKLVLEQVRKSQLNMK